MDGTTPTDGSAALQNTLAWLAAMPADIDKAFEFDLQRRESLPPMRFSPLNEREKQMLVAVYRAFLSGGRKAMDEEIEILLKFGVLEFSTSSSPAETPAPPAGQ